jgi:ABC-type nitrate/sulfonate/bicarbonate transport system substrate-binding protein
VLDRLLYGHSDAAHMIAPLAIATALGINRPARPLAVPFVLGLNGNAITLANDLALAVQPDYALGDPRVVGEHLAAIARDRAAKGRPIRFGVVHRYSSHNYMLRYWLAECGIVPDRDVEIITVAPPFAADALADGEVDGICVGEPWNSVAVEQGAGRIVLATAQIWRRGVEKVLAVQESRLADKRDAVERLIRAMRRAGRHFIDPANFEANAEILARPEYLAGDARIILRAISDRLLIAQGGEPVHFPDFMFQHREAANFPWVSQAQWLYTQLVRWQGGTVNPADAAIAARVFRPDIYRSALAGRDSPLPGASAKVEGAIDGSLPVGSVQGRLTLSNDSFFDGRQFDPNDLQSYLSTLPLVHFSHSHKKCLPR